jgi:hypothetical protein
MGPILTPDQAAIIPPHRARTAGSVDDILCIIAQESAALASIWSCGQTSKMSPTMP